MDPLLISEIIELKSMGMLIPYLGPAVHGLEGIPENPDTPERLVQTLTAKVTVPHKIRKNLTAAGQYIENFKHRKTLVSQLNDAFSHTPRPNALHGWLAKSASSFPLIVDVWYDPSLLEAFKGQADYGFVQGVSRAEHLNDWVRFYDAAGNTQPEVASLSWSTLIYQPLGCVTPSSNYILSDSDYVEVLTEIDIQTPIPEQVRNLRMGRHFLFLGCRFTTQLERTYARQIMKRSSDTHWAVLPEEPTRNELRFIEEQGIKRIDMPLDEFTRLLIGGGGAPLGQAA